ncbi:MAG: hypothetical protein HY043_18945 [Verrucomicrobia bacterium]|nr:hypothetical protein [Verrucomicrobiota bacterium]
MSFRERILHGLFVLIFAPAVCILAFGFVYEPIKFHYLIWRVESARTVAEEKEAFLLAARWGQVWELDRLRRSDLPKEAQHIGGERILRLEWLESAPWNGHPYCAYRVVLDEANLPILYAK